MQKLWSTRAAPGGWPAHYTHGSGGVFGGGTGIGVSEEHIGEYSPASSIKQEFLVLLNVNKTHSKILLQIKINGDI